MRSLLFASLLFVTYTAYSQIQIVEGRVYICKQTTDEIAVDGKADEESWKKAQWTDLFVDIEGNKKPKPYRSTKVKMLWDDKYFYFFAELEEPHIWAKLTERDAVIFHDNDFEIFIDPDGDTHNYVEYEVNALNTIWDLLLTKPYRDKGHAINAFDIKGLLSAVQINGTINDPSDMDESWTLEVAIPWKVFHEVTKSKTPPKPNDFWRVNFSRVQWETEIVGSSYIKKTDRNGNNLPENNWVWSPQRAIAMHEPEFWGIVVFSELNAGESVDFIADFGSEEVRQLLYHVHRAQLKYFKENKTYLNSKEQLVDFKVFNVGRPIQWNLEADSFRYHAIMQHPFNQSVYWHIDESGRIWKELK